MILTRKLAERQGLMTLAAHQTQYITSIIIARK